MYLCRHHKKYKMAQKKTEVILEDLYNELKGQDPKTLAILYNEYSTRMRHSGSHIWIVGSVFIPLSLSGIAIGLDNPFQTMGIAAFSIFLIWIWYSLSHRMRSLLERDLRICAVIEKVMLNSEKKMEKLGLPELMIVQSSRKRGKGLRKIRLIIPVGISIGWIIVSVISFILSM